jgi:hypothetical protein
MSWVGVVVIVLLVLGLGWVFWGDIERWLRR